MLMKKKHQMCNFCVLCLCVLVSFSVEELKLHITSLLKQRPVSFMNSGLLKQPKISSSIMEGILFTVFLHMGS